MPQAILYGGANFFHFLFIAEGADLGMGFYLIARNQGKSYNQRC